jgi:hypothetical protein
MKKSSPLNEKAITIEELPVLVPRTLAARFSALTPKTLKNHEWPRGPLHAVRRNSRVVSYHKSELLSFLGLVEPAPKRSPIRKKAAA